MTDEERAEKYLIRFLAESNIVDILPIKTAWDLRCLLIDVIKYSLAEGKYKWHVCGEEYQEQEEKMMSGENH